MNQAIEIKAGTDRRCTCRYRPIVKCVSLGLGSPQVEIPVDLESISLQGCMVRSRFRPELKGGEPIWFRVAEMRASDWVEGRVIAARKRFLRKQEIRIRFASTLPFQVFKVLVYGHNGKPLEPDNPPLHETDALWR